MAVLRKSSASSLPAVLLQYGFGGFRSERAMERATDSGVGSGSGVDVAGVGSGSGVDVTGVGSDSTVSSW